MDPYYFNCADNRERLELSFNHSSSYIMNNHVCTICNCDYSDDEGGMEGYFGILPVSFCATCFSCMIDMASQFVGERTEDGN